jgi:hypothetical protein
MRNETRWVRFFILRFAFSDLHFSLIQSVQDIDSNG